MHYLGEGPKSCDLSCFKMVLIKPWAISQELDILWELHLLYQHGCMCISMKCGAFRHRSYFFFFLSCPYSFICLVFGPPLLPASTYARSTSCKDLTLWWLTDWADFRRASEKANRCLWDPDHDTVWAHLLLQYLKRIASVLRQSSLIPNPRV